MMTTWQCCHQEVVDGNCGKYFHIDKFLGQRIYIVFTARGLHPSEGVGESQVKIKYGFMRWIVIVAFTVGCAQH
jgi:hypothetical protein